MKEFFKLLRRYTTLGITPKVKEAFDEAFISLVNIHLVADEIEGRAQMKEISTTYRNMLGKILYEIAEYNNLDKGIQLNEPRVALYAGYDGLKYYKKLGHIFCPYSQIKLQLI